MNSLTIILSLVFIMAAMSYTLLTSKTVFYFWKRYLKLSHTSEEFFFSVKKERKENTINKEENTARSIVKENKPTEIKKDSQSFYSEKQNERVSSEESYLTDLEDKMRYYMDAEKYRSIKTLNQLKKLEEEWA